MDLERSGEPQPRYIFPHGKFYLRGPGGRGEMIDERDPSPLLSAKYPFPRSTYINHVTRLHPAALLMSDANFTPLIMPFVSYHHFTRIDLYSPTDSFPGL